MNKSHWILFAFMRLFGDEVGLRDFDRTVMPIAKSSDCVDFGKRSLPPRRLVYQLIILTWRSQVVVYGDSLHILSSVPIATAEAPTKPSMAIHTVLSSHTHRPRPTLQRLQRVEEWNEK